MGNYSEKKSKKLHWLLIGVVVVLLLIQLVPLTRDNPPVMADVNAPADVKAVLHRSCYDCHSNETAWPWYGYVAPVSWLVAGDVHEARALLNFSEWKSLPADKQRRLLGNIQDEIAAGNMPPPEYRLVHRDAALSETDKTLLRSWCSAAPGEK